IPGTCGTGELSLFEFQRQPRKSEPFDFSGPTIAGAGQVTRRKRSGTDDLACAQRLVWKATLNGGAKFSEAQRRAAQTVPSRSLFDELAILFHPQLETCQLFDQRGNLLRTDGHALAYYKCGMKSKGRDEVAGLKLPFRKRTIDNFES